MNREPDTRSLSRPGTKPLYKRIAPDALDRILQKIRTGQCMSEAAFAQEGISRESLNRALAWGKDLARRLEDGARLTPDEVGGHKFYLRVIEARGGLQESLYRQARGIVGVGSDGQIKTSVKAESMTACKILALIAPELRAPAYDPQELEAIRHLEAAKRGDPPEIEETPDETRARLAREAAALGLTLTAPPTEEERRAEIAAFLRAEGLRVVPVGEVGGDEYDPATAGPQGQ